MVSIVGLRRRGNRDLGKLEAHRGPGYRQFWKRTPTYERKEAAKASQWLASVTERRQRQRMRLRHPPRRHKRQYGPARSYPRLFASRYPERSVLIQKTKKIVHKHSDIPSMDWQDPLQGRSSHSLIPLYRVRGHLHRNGRLQIPPVSLRIWPRVHPRHLPPKFRRCSLKEGRLLVRTRERGKSCRFQRLRRRQLRVLNSRREGDESISFHRQGNRTKVSRCFRRRL